jgi:hypothetical protein
MSRALVLTIAIFVTSLALAQRCGDDRQKRVHATRTTQPPTIDGRLDDAVWKTIVPDTRFTQNFPEEGRAPSQRTELYVLYDDRALYIGVRAWDSNAASIVERLTRRDRDTDADKIQIDISSNNDRTTAYHFDLNCAGVLLDGVRSNDTDLSTDWDGLWLGATKRDAAGWSAELLIPLKTLRYESGRSEFGFQVRRVIQRRQEVDEWAYIPRSAHGEVSYYGVLDGLTGLHAARLFQIAPYIAAGLYIRYDQVPAQLNGTPLYGAIGADIKLGITPALTLDATINPDFAQVEADQVILNLSTLELFFPEKRPFFLEGADVFNTPLQMFYSRRIGHAPALPYDNEYTALEPPPPGRLYAAAKLSGLIAPRLTIGLLDAITGESSTVVSRRVEPDRAVALSTEPLANYGVLRLKRDVLSRSYVGLLATTVNRFEQPFAAAPALNDHCPNGDMPSRQGRCTHDAYTAALDFNMRTSDGDWGALGQLAGSARVAGPQHLVADGTTLGPGAAGMALALDAGKLNGKYTGTLSYRGYSPSFDNNDAGFNAAGNMHRLQPQLHYRILNPHSIIQDGDINIAAVIQTDWSFSHILQEYYWLGAQVRFRNFWTIYFEVDYNMDFWDIREARDGTAVRRSGGPWWVYWIAKTDPRRRVWFQTTGQFGRTRRGNAGDIYTQLALRPIPAVEIDILPVSHFAFGDPRWFDTRDNGDGTHDYYFAELDSREFDVTLRGTYSFTPTLTLQAYAQLFLDGGHYGQTIVARAAGRGSQLPFAAFRPALLPRGDAPDFRDGAINVNLVLRWELQPGSTILGVYTHAQGQTTFDPLSDGFGRPSLSRFSGGPGTDLFLIKLSLLLI